MGKGIIPNKNTICLDKVELSPKIRRNCVKHKVLDLVGDLYLLGGQLLAKLIVYKGGHPLHIRFLQKATIDNAIKAVKASEVLFDD